MKPRYWISSRAARRIKAYGFVRGFFSSAGYETFASGRDTRTLAVIPVLAPPQPPVAAPPRRRGCSFDCE